MAENGTPIDGPSCRFPLEHALDGRIFIVGGIYLDIVNEVASYPKEDSSQRAIVSRKARGGNAANTSTVLAELLQAAKAPCSVSWVGAVPRADDPDAAFLLRDLQASAVDTSLLEEVRGETGQPTSFITLAKDSGSRTIVSTRNGLRELSTEHFSTFVLPKARTEFDRKGALRWCHLECRHMPGVLHLAEALRQVQGWRDSYGGVEDPLLSVEIEKPALRPADLVPLLRLSDVVFFSNEFIEHRQEELLQHAAMAAVSPDAKAVPKPHRTEKEGTQQNGTGNDTEERHVALRCLSALRSMVASDRPALWICGWGSHGAFALDTASGREFYEPALKVDVADSVGAGDTLIAACIYALALGATPEETLKCGCSVAGKKVSQNGFRNLAPAAPQCILDALPHRLKHRESVVKPGGQSPGTCVLQ